MSLYDEYFGLIKKYEAKYPDSNVLVLMQVGSFYELYEIDSPIKIGKCKEIVELSQNDPDIGQNVKLAQKKNGTYSFDGKKHKIEPWMVGFPTIAFEKWKHILLRRDYTIVRVDQDEEASVGKKGKVRKVSEILTPGTDVMCIDSDINNISSTVVCLLIDCVKPAQNFEDYLITIGGSCIDLVNGTSVVNEWSSTYYEPLLAINQATKFISTHHPKEIIFFLNGLPVDQNKYKHFLIQQLEIESINSKYFFLHLDTEYLKINYQEQFFNKVFDVFDSTLSPLDEMDLNVRLKGAASFVCLLQYCYEHNENIIKYLKFPNTSQNEDKMYIPHNTITQLNLISNNQLELNSQYKSVNSLMSIVNYTKTAMGKRFLKDMILAPLTDVEKIKNYYNSVELFISNKNLNSIGEYLSHIPDLERYHRKLLLRTITPSEMSMIIQRGYESMKNLLFLLKEVKVNKFNDEKKFNKYYTFLQRIFNCDALKKCEIKNKSFKFSSEHFPFDTNLKIKGFELLIQSYETHQRYFNIIKKYKERFDAELPGFEKVDIDGFFITTTLKRAKTLKMGYRQIKKSNKYIVYNEELDECAKWCERTQYELEKKLLYVWRILLKCIIKNHSNILNSISNYVRDVDYVYSGAQCAIKNGYHKPEIKDEDHSFFEMNDFRHPIIEKIIDEEYITNNLKMNQEGMLLYGPNSIGKTSFAKAIGCNLILAQIGYYTPSKLTFSPYHKILTRLSGNDNLYKGQSSFVVEMVELKSILKNSDMNSLVLGDELCRGTETISGTSLTIATILSLIKRKSTFIFSTHMHHLPSNPRLSELESLRVCHLHIRYDRKKEKLIYDRKLKEGQGDSIYGLEVAESLHLDDEFLRVAKEIRHEIQGTNPQILSTKTSHFNSRVYIHECEMCGKSVVEENLDTHHIREQHLANEYNYIDHVPKNAKYNLMVLCRECHVSIHSKLIHGSRLIHEKRIHSNENVG